MMFKELRCRGYDCRSDRCRASLMIHQVIAVVHDILLLEGRRGCLSLLLLLRLDRLQEMFDRCYVLQ